MRKNDAAVLAAWCRAQLNGTPIGAALSDITQPVLFMPGELEVERLAFPERPLPSHAELRVIPGANHVTAFLSVDAVTAGLRELTSPIGAVGKS